MTPSQIYCALATDNRYNLEFMKTHIHPLERRQLLSAVYFVDAHVAGGTGDGSSWANASTDLEAIVTNAPEDATIKVAAGDYIPTGAGRDSTFSLKRLTQLLGGYAGASTAGVDPDTRNPSLYTTTLDGN